jgi:hypothetical protein
MLGTSWLVDRVWRACLDGWGAWRGVEPESWVVADWDRVGEFAVEVAAVDVAEAHQ